MILVERGDGEGVAQRPSPDVVVLVVGLEVVVRLLLPASPVFPQRPASRFVASGVGPGIAVVVVVVGVKNDESFQRSRLRSGPLLELLSRGKAQKPNSISDQALIAILGGPDSLGATSENVTFF